MVKTPRTLADHMSMHHSGAGKASDANDDTGGAKAAKRERQGAPGDNQHGSKRHAQAVAIKHRERPRALPPQGRGLLRGPVAREQSQRLRSVPPPTLFSG